jgi:hypothetical protein
MEIQIIKAPISVALLAKLAQQQFGDVIKATVDVSKGIMALGGELHSDEEVLLIEKGSDQKDLWGINLYPAQFGKKGFVEFDSMINIRPSQGNMSRGVNNIATQKEIRNIVNKLIIKDFKNGIS